jgi:hypothetical protein
MEGIKETLKSHGVKDDEIAKLVKKFTKETAQDEIFVNEVATELIKKSVLQAMKLIKEEKTPKKKKREAEEEEVKKEVGGGGEEEAKKKKKKEKRDYDEIKAEIDNGKKLTELTIEDLKVIIRKRNETEKPPIKLDGKKEDLIQKVETFIDQL